MPDLIIVVAVFVSAAVAIFCGVQWHRACKKNKNREALANDRQEFLAEVSQRFSKDLTNSFLRLEALVSEKVICGWRILAEFPSSEERTEVIRIQFISNEPKNTRVIIRTRRPMFVNLVGDYDLRNKESLNKAISQIAKFYEEKSRAVARD